jgi:CubicO group peptidase (beta-lactamase class C family)
MPDIDGEVAPGFERVRDVFEANFADGGEVGAAFSAYHRGRKVVDLWGGVADAETGAPWGEDTLVLVFSTTKGATAVCANRLVQEGRLDLDAPVARYWPEFEQAGKGDIPVRWLLSHQAGLAWCEAEMTTAEALSWDPVVTALAAEAPHWEPGSQHGYHAITFGWLVGEVIRRITGTSVGTHLRADVCDPLGLDLWIGLPEEQDHRVATVINFVPPDVTVDRLRHPEGDPTAQLMSQFIGPDTVLGKALFSPGFALADGALWGSRQLRAAEIPSANGVTDARSVARMYAACIGEVDGVRLLTPEQLAAATTRQTTGPDTVLFGFDIQFGLGFMLHSSLLAIGGPASFGHFGAGGSMGWADPEADLAFGYVMNRMDLGLAGDLRSFNLVGACYEAIA